MSDTAGTTGGDMPERIKPVYVDGFYDTPEDMPKEMLGPNLEVIPTPVLTLDQIEAWLQNNVDAVAPNSLHRCVDDLLAQVQAWKEEAP